MSAKSLILIAIVWFGTVVLWSRFASGLFFGTGHGKWAKGVAYALIYLIQVVVLGWIAPLTLGIYLLFKH